MTNVKESGTTNLATYSYDPLSRRTGIAYGDGTTASYTYNVNDDMATDTQTFTGSSVTYTYIWNKVHQRTRMAVSNDAYLRPRPSGAYTDTYTTNNMNQYTNLSGDTSFTYDNNGNLTGLDGNTYTYDTENRLVGATVSGTTATYVYAPTGIRRSKTVSGSLSTYTPDVVRNQEIAVYDNSGNLASRYVYGPGIDEPITWVSPDSSDHGYMHDDGLGSTAADTHGGTVTAQYSYSTYGLPTNTGNDAYMFTGRRYDFESGLFHYRNRSYNASLGRFMQPDPIGTDGGINLYEYAGGDPINKTDPQGTVVLPAAALLVGGFAVGGGLSAVGVQA